LTPLRCVTLRNPDMVVVFFEMERDIRRGTEMDGVSVDVADIC
jgi:hypothetical protein